MKLKVSRHDMKSLGRKGLMQKVGVGIIVGLDYWTGLLDSPKQNKHLVQCRTEVHSVISLMLLPTVFPGVPSGQSHMRID